MRICVAGLWHLGSVTAACLAEHFPTVGWDPEPSTIKALTGGKPPVAEPGLAELIASGLRTKRLEFTTDAASAVRGASVLWICFDTPVSEDDVADVDFVKTQVRALFPYIEPHTLVLISSQVPVGSTQELQSELRALRPQLAVSFAYAPENLRLGAALDVFRRPERIVVGAANSERDMLRTLLSPFSENLEWMSIASAEMTKHALNAFLATSVTFINEIASLAERVGADATEVQRGLKSDVRIGPRAYLKPGGAFAGGTLARDVMFLKQLGLRLGLPTHLMTAVRSSNDEHRAWPERKLKELLTTLAGRTISVLGLTYKPGTDTLRRSSAVELCRVLSAAGVRIKAFDPAVKSLPEELRSQIALQSSVAEALTGAHAAVLATEWTDFKSLGPSDFVDRMESSVVLDPNGFLDAAVRKDPRIRYAAVGTPSTGLCS
jgi:UDPglucose 6-dehydrogenase